MSARANLAVAIAAIRELIEETLRSRRPDAETARALALGLEGMRALWEALISEDTDREQYERDCADVFDSAPEACVITDVNGVVRRANDAATRLLGAPRSALLRRPIDAFLTGVDVSVRDIGRSRSRISALCWTLRRLPESANAAEEQKQPAEQRDVREQRDAREVALDRIALRPEAMEDGGRGHREGDQAADAERRMPVE